MRVEDWSLSQTQPYRLFPFLFHKSGPIRVGFGKIALRVFVEIIAHTLAVLKQQMAIDDLKCFRIDFHQFVFRHTEGAEAAIGWFVLGGLFVEARLVLARGKKIRGAVMDALKLHPALHWFVLGEKRHGIVTLHSQAVFVQIEQVLGLRKQ